LIAGAPTYVCTGKNVSKQREKEKQGILKIGLVIKKVVKTK